MMKAVFALLALLGLGPAQAAEPATVKTFHDAVHRGDVATVRALLAKDAALAVSTDRFGFQPVHLLDMYFERAILELLLANGADVNAVNDDGTTLLHILTDPYAVPVVVAAGGRLEARDMRGRTPLIAKAGEGDTADVMAALIAAGADVHARSPSGETALSNAREQQDEAKIALLLEAGAR